MPLIFLRVMALLILISLASSAIADNGRYILWGNGSDSCGSFIQERKRNSATYDMQLSWVAGFISAQNGVWIAGVHQRFPDLDATKFDFLKGVDQAGLEAWLVKYCQEEPLQNLGSAALKLNTTLIERETKLFESIMRHRD